MTAKRLVNHNGRVTDFVEDTIEAIKASDLLLLMDVVKEATGLYNALERRRIDAIGLDEPIPAASICPEEFDALGTALRALGLMEVQPE